MMQLKVIFAALAVFAAPCALAEDQVTPPKKATYFLIDASGSMGDLLASPAQIVDGKSPRTKQDLAESKFKQLFDALPASASVAKTYFHGICGQDIQVKAAAAKANVSVVGPPPPQADTPIAEALEAALSAAGTAPATIILITDGGQSCGATTSHTRDICSVAWERLPGRPNVDVRVEFVAASDSERAYLRCISDAQQRPSSSTTKPNEISNAPTASASAEPQERHVVDFVRQPDTEDAASAVTFANSLPWAFLALVFALSFVMLGRSFAKAHRDLEIRLGKIDDDAAKNTFVDFSKQKPRFLLAALIFGCAFTASFVVLWGTGDFISFARSGAANALNNEFGAAVFLAGLMTLGVFAGSQYWRYAELRAKYGIASNEAGRIKNAREDAAKRRREAKDEQEKTRLESVYDSYRTAFASREYTFDKYLVAGDSADSNQELLEDVVGAMKYLAAGPRPSRDIISRTDIDTVWRLATSWSVRSPQALIDFIPTTRLPDTIRTALRELFYPRQASLAADQNEVLQKLKKELELLVTQHTASSQSAS